MAGVQDVAAALLERRGAMDTFKLQKLVYYCQAWHLVWEDKALFAEPIEAWAAGPVVRALYDLHRGSYSVNAWPNGDARELKKKERRTVEIVADSYGELTGRRLSLLTHSEHPWQSARAGLGPTDRSDNEITLVSMKSYYSALDSDTTAEPVSSLATDD